MSIVVFGAIAKNDSNSADGVDTRVDSSWTVDIYRVVTKEAIDTLREDLRKIVHYAWVDGLRYQEIAQIMDIPIGTVMSRLYRARKQLQGELADLAEEHGILRDQGTKVEV